MYGVHGLTHGVDIDLISLKMWIGTESHDLAAAWMELLQINDDIQRYIIKFFFLNDCDSFMKGVIERDYYTTDHQHKENLSSLLKKFEVLVL